MFPVFIKSILKCINCTSSNKL